MLGACLKNQGIIASNVTLIRGCESRQEETTRRCGRHRLGFCRPVGLRNK